MQIEIKNYKFDYDSKLYKIHVEQEHEYLDCIDVDYTINDIEHLRIICNEWVQGR